MSFIEEYNTIPILINGNKLEEANEILLRYEKYDNFAPFCHYRMAQIANIIGDSDLSYQLYYKAFDAKPDITAHLYSQDHPNKNYIYPGLREENEFNFCPLCGKKGTAHWTYPLTEAGFTISAFNPVRQWMYCEDCHHMWARHFPKVLSVDGGWSTNTRLFGYYSNILKKIRDYTNGMILFEVGVGGCECLLAAREIGYQCAGMEILPRLAEKARKDYHMDVEQCDFIDYQPKQTYDIVMMGDVIEHVSDPVFAMKKANSMLNEDGVLWISTPNFDSAFSQVVGDRDPMRRELTHVNYFSQTSFYSLLEMAGLSPIDYHISEHYNGSMEIIAVKSSRFS